jgi:hypothetical protein
MHIWSVVKCREMELGADQSEPYLDFAMRYPLDIVGDRAEPTGTSRLSSAGRATHS